MNKKITVLLGVFLATASLTLANPGKNTKPMHPNNGNNGNNSPNSLVKPMDKNHPVILPSHDWRDDRWYGNDDYYKKNWGYSKDSFRRWLERNPRLSRRDRKSLEKLYKEQLKHEKKLRKDFAKYNREISTLPAYRGHRDPMGAFIEDYLYDRDKVTRYKLSNNFRNELSREEKAISDFFNFIDNFK